MKKPLSNHGFINSYLGELSSLVQPPTGTRVQALPIQRHRRWISPPKAIPKNNVDGVVSKTKERGVASGFCRNSDGQGLQIL
jgi:hypothetical protein